MNRKFRFFGLSALLLLGMATLTVTACAQENGYWTSRVDEQGQTVPIFVYTEPVEWTICEDPSAGCCGDAAAQAEESAVPIAAAETAVRRLSAGAAEANAVPAAGMAPADQADDAAAEQPLYLIALLGAAALAGLGYALYRAV
ncbi:MAG TPA: hypothetical protein H9684_06670 [Firmicutes bacterium]|nr:hypothetical protein [Bacillota bacterium]